MLFRSTVQVAAPEPKVDSSEKKKNGVSTTTVPNITLSAPQRLALAKPTIAAALGPNPGRESLRTRFNANEILVSLMLTYVADLLVKYLVYGPWRDPQANNFPITVTFSDDATFALLAGWADWLEGTRINTSVFLTLAAIPLAWLFMERSFLGFQLTVAGHAPAAARYAGFSDRRLVWIAFLIGGAAAGIAGVTEVAGPIGNLNDRWTPGYGFTAIIVAALGRLNAVGIVLASLLMALLYLGGEAAQISMQLPKAISQVFQGLLLLFLLGCDVLVGYRVARRASRAAPAPAAEVA